MIFMISYSLSGQRDTLEAAPTVLKEKKGSIFSGRPGKAMLMSLVLPGAGQVYNKSYFRVPFVLGAVGGMGLLLDYNSKYYKCRRAAYEAAIDGVVFVPKGYCEDGLEFITDPARLRVLRDEANANRQLSIVGFSVVWLLNGIDAFVDAHLKEFDIDADLSLYIGSKADNDPYAPMRLGLFVNFK